MALNLAKEAEDASTAGFYKTCSHGRSREDECSDGDPLTEGRVSSKESICHGYRQEGK